MSHPLSALPGRTSILSKAGKTDPEDMQDTCALPVNICLRFLLTSACCRFLRPGGAVLPDIATMFVAGAGPGALDLDFWSDVYGFSYRCCTLFDCMGPLHSTSTN